MKQSGFLSLKQRDALRGLIMAIGTPLLYYIQEMIPNYDIDNIYKIAISAGVTYLIKNFFTPKDTGNKLFDEPIVGDRPKDRG